MNFFSYYPFSRIQRRQASLLGAIFKNDIQKLKHILDGGVNPNLPLSVIFMKTQQTALFIAAHEGNKKAVDLLLRYGADKYYTDQNGEMAYHRAIEAGHGDLARILQP